MQHALMRTWYKSLAPEASRSSPLSLSKYREIGGFESALSNHAEELYAELVNADREEPGEMARTAEYVFRALTDIDPEGRAIRRPQRFSDLVVLACAQQKWHYSLHRELGLAARRL